MGVSPRRFGGWEPKTISRYSYDDEGRLAQTITTREPEWDESDRVIMMAVADLRADMHHCGHPLSESLAYQPGEEPDGYVRPEFEGETRICLGCLAQSKLMARWETADEKSRKQGRTVHPSARVHSVRRTN